MAPDWLNMGGKEKMPFGSLARSAAASEMLKSCGNVLRVLRDRETSVRVFFRQGWMLTIFDWLGLNSRAGISSKKSIHLSSLDA
jgi:hypothetical protein